DFHRRPEIIALDDFDLSSSGSDSDAGEVVRNRRQLRRLPNRRDFEFVRRSIDSVSSLGIRSSDAHSSIASGSEVSNRSRASEAGPLYGGAVLPWHLDLIEDSDDDQAQDAQAALARLEGRLDLNAQKEKAKKVDRWMKMVAARMAAGETGAGLFADLKEEEEEEAEPTSAAPSSSAASMNGGLGKPEDALTPVSADSSRRASVVGDREEKPTVSVSVEEPAGSPVSEDEPVEARTPATDVGAQDTAYVDLVHQQREALGAITPTPPPMIEKAEHMPLTPTLTSPGTREEAEVQPMSANTATADTPVAAFPPAVSSSGTASQPATMRAPKRSKDQNSTLIFRADSLLGHFQADSKNAPPPSTLSYHRSFILGHRSEAIAQHFAMIDRELFLTVKFNEIVSGWWANPKADVDIASGELTDWQGYVKERARLKLDRSKPKPKSTEGNANGSDASGANGSGNQNGDTAGGTVGAELSAIAALRARFNMMVAFTTTDIVFTHPAQRHAVFCKFIRIAWKSYLINNFAAVVALMTSMQSPMVTTSMKHVWSRIPMWEMRVFEDLKEFASPRGNFKYIREAIAVLNDRQDDGQPNAN
ncbi:hypothetical protein FRB90_009829, partial [Tulasnella sp. 427]